MRRAASLLAALAILSACKPAHLTEIPADVAQQLLDAQTANQIAFHQSQAALALAREQEAQKQKERLDELIAASQGNDPNAQLSLLKALAADPTLMGDPARLRGLGAREGTQGQTMVTEWDPRNLTKPGYVQAQEANKHMTQGWAIQNVGYDRKKQVFLLHWMKVIRTSVLPGGGSTTP